LYCGPGILAASSSDNVIRLWDTKSRQERGRLLGHTGSVTTLAWYGKSGTLVSGSFDTTVRVWQVKVEPAADRISRRPNPLPGTE
jgi:WD40 repeat protein